jgi:ATP-dependent DNA helicase RecQ
VAVCRNGFDAIELLRAKSKVNIAEVIGIAYAGSSKRKQQLDDSPHPILLSQLKKIRDSICEQKGKPIYMVAATNTLHELALYLPQTPKELLQINGFGEQKVQQFGEAFLAVIKQYCDDHHLDSQISSKEPKRQRKKKADAGEEDIPKQNTRQVTYEWWKSGKTVAEIAAERKLQPATIETHLMGYVLNGLVPRQVLISDDVFEKAAAIVKDLQTTSMGPVKEIMADEISFGQIRLVLQWLINNGEFVPPQAGASYTIDE